MASRAPKRRAAAPTARAPKDNVLTIRIAGKTGNVRLGSLVRLLKDALGMLRETDSGLSSGEQTLEWEVVEASLNSPLLITIVGAPIHKDHFNRDVVKTCLQGLDRLAHGKEPSERFTEAALEKAKALVDTLNDGIASLALSSPAIKKVVEPSADLSLKIDEVLKSRYYYTETTLEGRLEKLDVHDKFAFQIFDVATEWPTRCFFPEGLLPKILSFVRARVAVSGRVKYNRAGNPVSMHVATIRRVSEKSRLPQFNEGEQIDLTGGMDSAIFIRRQRDAE